MRSSPTKPTAELIRKAYDATLDLPQDGWPDRVIPHGLGIISNALQKLPLGFLPESLAWSARQLATAIPGRKEIRLQDTWGVAVSSRISLGHALNMLSTQKQSLVDLPDQDRAEMREFADLPSKIWALCSVHHQQCRAITEATDPYRLSAEAEDARLRQGTVGGLVIERGEKVAAFLIRELRYSEFGDHLLHDVRAHPDTPDAADEIMEEYLERGTNGRRVRAVIRGQQRKLRAILESHGFLDAGVIRRHFLKEDGGYLPGYCMERPAITKKPDPSELPAHQISLS